MLGLVAVVAAGSLFASTQPIAGPMECVPGGVNNCRSFLGGTACFTYGEGSCCSGHITPGIIRR